MTIFVGDMRHLFFLICLTMSLTVTAYNDHRNARVDSLEAALKSSNPPKGEQLLRAYDELMRGYLPYDSAKASVYGRKALALSYELNGLNVRQNVIRRFAQMLYALQFFNSLLLGELYFLPKEQPNSINDFVRNLLFVTPFSLMTRDNLVKYKAGQEIFKKDDYSDYVYYIVSGIVCEYRNEKKVLFEKGSFCGEYEFLLNTDRTGSATAITDCTLIKIPALDFSLLLKKNTKVASIAMSKLVSFRKIFD